MNINKDVNLYNKKIIYDLTPFSHLDYPNHLSCIIWFSGCALRCKYCYNKNIVFSKYGKYFIDDIFSFLDKRKNLLDAVVLSGGEATRYNLVDICQEIKNKGFKIKLDTSGIHFNNIKKLIDLHLLDYIALDYKAPKYKYKYITKSNLNNYNEFEKTLEYLISNKCHFEIRTTAHFELLDEDDINFIIKDLSIRKYKGKYYLQNFLFTEDNIDNIIAPIKQYNLDKIQGFDNNIIIKYRNF